jgi:hypothetical protein
MEAYRIYEMRKTSVVHPGNTDREGKILTEVNLLNYPNLNEAEKALRSHMNALTETNGSREFTILKVYSI